LNKLLIISSEFPPGPGGIGTHTFNIANELSNRGNDITVCTVSDYANENEKKVFDMNCGFIVKRFKRHNNIFITWYMRIKLIYGVINNSQINHVICSGRFPIWIIGCLKLWGVKRIIGILHGSEVGYGIKRKWLYFCLARSDLIIAVSNFSSSLLPKILRRKTMVIHNGINLEHWNVLPPKANLGAFPILLTVGSLSIRKGQHNVINALPKIRKIFPRVHYHCVGPDSNKGTLIEQIQKLGLEDIITINGILSHANLEKMYAKSHVIMLLVEEGPDGDVEGYGISVLEGNLFGKPAIGSMQTGVAESIIPKVNGLLVNPKNPNEIIRALNKILSDYNKFSERCQKSVKRKTWSNQIRKYEKFIF
tara:strand:+ start:3888 stop:4979 length:1092 start_codon:yes stop_codon:yes gene_type:complete